MQHVLEKAKIQVATGSITNAASSSSFSEDDDDPRADPDYILESENEQIEAEDLENNTSDLSFNLENSSCTSLNVGINSIEV